MTLPADDVVKTARLWNGQVLAVIVALGLLLWVQVLRVAGVEVGLQAQALGWTECRFLQPALVVLGALIQHDELVFLPVASLGVWSAWRGLHAGALGEAGIFAAAGLCRGVWLAVRLEGTLRAAHEAFTSGWGDPQRVVLMDQVFLHLCAVIFFFLVLEGQHRKCTFPRAKSNGLAERLVVFLP